MFVDYADRVAERGALGLPPLPLTRDAVMEITVLLASGKERTPGEFADLIDLLSNRVPPGVDPAAGAKADFLAKVATDEVAVDGFPPKEAIRMLGTMLGGYNLQPLVRCLSSDALAAAAAEALSGCLLGETILPELEALLGNGNPAARRVLESWAEAEWFVRAPRLPECLRLAVYKVEGEVNTDDLSPARQAPTRPDIPLHALSMGETRFPGGVGEIVRLRDEGAREGYAAAFAADTLGVGSSRKSATNSLVWTLGDDIPHIPNKRRGGVALATRIAPIFHASFMDAGGLPIQADVSALATGMRIALEIDAGVGAGRMVEGGKELAAFAFPRDLADSWRAGGRINLIIGRRLADRAAAILGTARPKIFYERPAVAREPGRGHTLAQKMVGRACGRDGVLPGEYCEPVIATVGSQDTTGPMTRDELQDLACLRFAAPMVMQSFCHTAAYPTERDVAMQRTLPEFMTRRGGLALKPGDGIVHSWLNRLLVPDAVGVGGDSHTRFPLGISFPAGSGLVALAAAMGFIPLVMPESVLVSFSGALPEGITLRDAVNYIPLKAVEMGLLDLPVPGAKNGNVFNGRIMELEGLDGFTPEEAFEFSCASAERSAAAATVALSGEKVGEYVGQNVKLIQSLIDSGYGSRSALESRKAELEAWLKNPALLARDANAGFAAAIPVDFGAIREPVVARPNNPDLAAWLSDLAGERVDEVFIGSCMTNIAQFRAAAALLDGAAPGVKRLWITPPTRMDREQLEREGVLAILEKAGARLEIPGCSLCMGNQARVGDKAVVFSTSTRNFNNRMGADAQVYLGSSPLAAVVARLGRIPAPEDYFKLYREKVAQRIREFAKPLSFS
ncbi:MAG: bifunctional aconitate hydratase 2/2-methylisocitrate dehydratase [Planctomycetota bacterium]|jgi:aconitate hydratase 2/2-methylisocitrate dehydratase|nr:bifunctional aconitate hydratase 2/2-methylisocitrate dehydratase [Planctomycetota bacterium]